MKLKDSSRLTQSPLLGPRHGRSHEANRVAVLIPGTQTPSDSWPPFMDLRRMMRMMTFQIVPKPLKANLLVFRVKALSGFRRSDALL